MMVDDVDAMLARELSLGGQTALPKMPIPTLGWLAYANDTEGNTFGMMPADPGAA
jgi:predicted enzyme related to lactoylglutathione lyase